MTINSGAQLKGTRAVSARGAYSSSPRPLFPQKSSKGALHAITDGERYYSVCMSTRQPVFLTKPFAYTYNARAEALAVADRLRKAGFRVGVVRC